VRLYSAPPSVVLAARIYAEEWIRCLDADCGQIVAHYAIAKTVQRTGLSVDMVKLCSRLAMEMMREADLADYPNVRTGVSGQPVRRLRPVGHLH
jgi:hypothetical protein